MDKASSASETHFWEQEMGLWFQELHTQDKASCAWS